MKRRCHSLLPGVRQRLGGMTLALVVAVRSLSDAACSKVVAGPMIWKLLLASRVIVSGGCVLNRVSDQITLQ